MLVLIWPRTHHEAELFKGISQSDLLIPTTSALSGGRVTHRGTICVHLLGPAPAFRSSVAVLQQIFCEKWNK
jgi:hypothetical protein